MKIARVGRPVVYCNGQTLIKVVVECVSDEQGRWRHHLHATASACENVLRETGGRGQRCLCWDVSNQVRGRSSLVTIDALFLLQQRFDGQRVSDTSTSYQQEQRSRAVVSLTVLKALPSILAAPYSASTYARCPHIPFSLWWKPVGQNFVIYLSIYETDEYGSQRREIISNY